ncbi:MAG: hypothetical protein DSY82_08695 [Flavobacteriia bacterium]|nr:MAG: hypothetical protein DSY82_08695 [Flavobacteriia bacterium]
MINQLESKKENTLIYEFSEFITQYDIKKIEKDIEKVLKNRDKVNLMLYVHVEGENIASFVEEFRAGIKYWNKLNKIAYIGKKEKWARWVVIDNFFTKFKEKYFELDDIERAWKWLNE